MKLLRRLPLVLVAVVPIAAACANKEPDPSLLAEAARREEFRARMLVDEDAGRARQVASTDEIDFREDFSKVLYDPPNNFRNHAFRWMGKYGRVRLKTHGAKPMLLQALGWVDEKVLRTQPVITFRINGHYVHTSKPIKDHFWEEMIVPSELLRDHEWVDLVMELSSVAFHWLESPPLAVAVLYKFEWREP